MGNHQRPRSSMSVVRERSRQCQLSSLDTVRPSFILPRLILLLRDPGAYYAPSCEPLVLYLEFVDHSVRLLPLI